MCAVSMIMDHFGEKWGQIGQPPPNWPPPTNPSPYQQLGSPQITPQEIAEFRKLLERARKYDKENNQPDCELEQKKQLVRDLAEKHGIKIDFL